MAVIKARSTLTPPNNSGNIDTTGISDIVVHVASGQATVEAFLDSAAASGYKFKMMPGPKVIAAANKLVITARGTEDLVYEVYSA